MWYLVSVSALAIALARTWLLADAGPVLYTNRQYTFWHFASVLMFWVSGAGIAILKWKRFNLWDRVFLLVVGIPSGLIVALYALYTLELALQLG